MVTVQDSTRKRTGWSVLVKGIWIAFALAVCLKCWVRPAYRSVYPVYAWASNVWWQDQSLYTFSETGHNYRYSPAFAIAFTPFTWLPVPVGSSLWCLLNVAVLFFSLQAMTRQILPVAWAEHQHAVFMALTILASVGSLWVGQTNSLIIAMIFCAGGALLRQRWWSASLLLTIPVYIKVWPLAVVLLLAVCWPRPLIWRIAVLMAVLAAVPFLTKPPSTVLWQYHEWWVKLADPHHDKGPLYPSVWTFGEDLGVTFSDRGQRLAQAATGLLVFLGCVWQRRRLLKDCPRRLLLGVISLWACWQLLFGPGTERITFSLVAPSLAWAVVASHAENRARAWMTVTWLVLAAFGCGDIEKALVHVLPPATTMLPVGVILFLGWLLWHESSGSAPAGSADIGAAEAAPSRTDCS